jgi:hypothetical protein
MMVVNRMDTVLGGKFDYKELLPLVYIIMYKKCDLCFTLFKFGLINLKKRGIQELNRPLRRYT